MTVALIQCAAGASGDMFLGAWLDAGAPEEKWRQLLSGLSVSGFQVAVDRVKRSGISAAHVTVTHDEQTRHRHLPEIERIIRESDLPPSVVEHSLQAFHHLAEAEATVHGTTPERIHFHEVGALDAIVDIVGSMAAWHLLGEPDCVATPIEVGGGHVTCAHGVMPVPAPAAELLLHGFPTYSTGAFGETVTPTGAAILRTLARPAEPRPFVARRTGYGAGTRELPLANVLRISLGEWFAPGARKPDAAHSLASGWDAATAGAPPLAPGTHAVSIAANVDDMNPEFAGFVLERLLALGAMDAAWAPLVMKKGRPAQQLQVLCAPDRLPALAAEIVRQTTTIGLRFHPVWKWELERATMTVDTPYGPVDVKTAQSDGKTVNVAPEYESCRKLAQRQNVPLKQVYQSALAEAMRLRP